MKWGSPPFVGTLIAIGLLIGVAYILPRCRHIDTVDPTASTLRQIAIASKQFQLEFSAWPQSLNDFTNNPKNLMFMDWGSAPVQDPWGNPFVYMPFNTNTGCGIVLSWGADGEPGGKGHNRDRVVRFP